MRLPTASYLDVAIECDGASIYPCVDEDTEYSITGRLKHQFLHAVRKAGREIALAQIPEGDIRDFCAAIDITKLPHTGEPEVALAWDYTTDKARVLGFGLGRDYSDRKPTELVGTVDWAQDFLGQAVIHDYKSGYQYVAPDTWQMKALSLYAARAVNADEAESNIVRITDGEPRTFTAKFGAMDLDGIANRLVRLVKRIEKADAQYRETGSVDLRVGDHCDRCKCIRSCPAHVALIKASPEDLGAALSGGEALDNAAIAWDRIKAAKRIIEIAEQGVKRLARLEPIPLSSGKVLKAVPGNEKIDASIGSAVLVDRFGVEALAAVESKITKASIKRALNGRSEAAIEAIRDAGGITQGEPVVKEVSE